MGLVYERIRSKLQKKFDPIELSVRDDSDKHAGHAGARPEGETHFSVNIVAEAFSGLNRVACHRLINEALADELADRVHALAIKAKAPDD